MMKVRQNYTLELSIVQRLNAEVRNQYKSQFVENAIRDRLNGKKNFSFADISDEFLFQVILSRNYKRDGTTALEAVLFEAIKQVLDSNN